jgi:hypothetical protein
MLGIRRRAATLELLRNGLLFFLAAGVAGLVTVLLLSRAPGAEVPLPRAPNSARARKSDSRPPRRPSEEPHLGRTQKTLPLEVPEQLSVVQQAALDSPSRAAHLQSEVMLSLNGPYGEAVKCYEGPYVSVLEFSFRFRSLGLTANILDSRFVKVMRGAPVEPQVIDCVNRALSQPFAIHADRDRPFPEDLDGDLPVEIVLGGANKAQTADR